MSRFVQSWKYWVLGGLIQMVMPAIYNVHRPEVILVKLDENATLPCIFNAPAPNCYWSMDGDVVDTEGRYRFVGNRTMGNCTLMIHNFRLSDSGFWQCGLPKTDSSAAVKFKLFKVYLNSNAGVTFLQYPRNVDVLPGQSITLPCSFNADASSCYWLKEGQVKMLRMNHIYTNHFYVGKATRGECPLNIAKVSLEDDGLWQCVYENATANISLLSPNARLKVFVPSKSPYISVNGTALANGSSLYIPSIADLNRIICKAEDGNPEAHLTWDLEGRKTNGSSIKYVRNSAVPKLKTSEIELMEQIGPSWHNKVLSCIATHPTFSNVHETAQVVIYLPEPTTTTSVRIRGLDELSLETRTDQDVSIECKANGVPPPKYKWLRRHRENDEWIWFHNGQNVTFKAMEGEYSCLAWNELSESHVTLSNETISIIIPAETTQVDVWFQEKKLENSYLNIKNSENATLRCLANGHPSSLLRWEIWRDDHWERVQDGHNITLLSGKGKYSCVAWNIKYRNSTVRSISIYVNANGIVLGYNEIRATVHAQPIAMIVGAVVACVSLLAIVCSVAIFCQRRKGEVSIQELNEPNPKVTFY